MSNKDWAMGLQALGLESAKRALSNGALPTALWASFKADTGFTGDCKAKPIGAWLNQQATELTVKVSQLETAIERLTALDFAGMPASFPSLETAKAKARATAAKAAETRAAKTAAKAAEPTEAAPTLTTAMAVEFLAFCSDEELAQHALALRAIVARLPAIKRVKATA